MSAELPDYASFVDALAPAGGYLTPAEIHGFLCGLVAGGHRLVDPSWRGAVETLLNDSEPVPDEARPMLDELYQQVCLAYVDMGFGLALLLPDENQALPERLEGLGLWCQGFLAGFSVAPKSGALPEDVNDALKDLSEISQIDVDVEESEDMENAYMEVCEHVRLSAQLVYAELGDKPKTETQQSVH